MIKCLGLVNDMDSIWINWKDKYNFYKLLRYWSGYKIFKLFKITYCYMIILIFVFYQLVVKQHLKLKMTKVEHGFDFDLC